MRHFVGGRPSVLALPAAEGKIEVFLEPVFLPPRFILPSARLGVCSDRIRPRAPSPAAPLEMAVCVPFSHGSGTFKDKGALPRSDVTRSEKSDKVTSTDVFIRFPFQVSERKICLRYHSRHLWTKHHASLRTQAPFGVCCGHCDRVLRGKSFGSPHVQ